MHRHRRRRKFTVNKVILFLVLIFLLFMVLSKMYYRSPLIVYAKQKSYYYASVLINDSISNQIVPNIDTSKIINMETKSNGYVTSVIVDVYQINMLISKMTKQIQDQLLIYQKDSNHELNHLSIPIGVMFDNPIMNNIGPELNIKLKIIGSVYTDIVSSVKPYGINNSLIEVVIKTKVRFQVAIPFQKDEIEVETNTPLLIKIIQGSVPHYYYTGGNGNFSNPPKDDNPQPDSGLLE
ncbi:sporulation protein YunB [Mycoplasmatota bacterium]|nr:sporulation protein YunB [Mycoplasmatota bacterium]